MNCTVADGSPSKIEFGTATSNTNSIYSNPEGRRLGTTSQCTMSRVDARCCRVCTLHAPTSGTNGIFSSPSCPWQQAPTTGLGQPWANSGCTATYYYYYYLYCFSAHGLLTYYYNLNAVTPAKLSSRRQAELPLHFGTPVVSSCERRNCPRVAASNFATPDPVPSPPTAGA